MHKLHQREFSHAFYQSSHTSVADHRLLENCVKTARVAAAAATTISEHRWKVKMQRKFLQFSFNLYVAIVHTILLYFRFGQNEHTLPTPEMCPFAHFVSSATLR